MMLPLYRAATRLGAPLITAYMNKRLAAGKEDAERFQERHGEASIARPPGTLVWLHAASVGESLSMLPLIETLASRHPDMTLLMTTGTVTSAKLMAERLPDPAIHQYVPVDRLPYIRRFLDHWRPDLALWAESEFWPNLISETQSRGIPMVLINGRISPKSFAGWSRARGLIGALLKDFTLCLGQTEEDVERLRQLGAKSYKCLGNLKFAVPALPADGDDVLRFASLIEGRPRWLAASTHAGEEEIIAGVHAGLRDRHRGLLTIIVPRHPTRGAEITQMLRGRGLRVAQRSSGENPGPDTEIYVADTMGELGMFFRLSDIAFMGKSLVPLGGQNPLEAMRLGCAIIHGPHMMNFQLIAEEMKRQGCALQVADNEGLNQAVDELLKDQRRCREMAEKGEAYVDSQAKVVERVADEIDALLRFENKSKRTHATA